MKEEIYINNELKHVCTTDIPQALCELIYLSTFMKDYKIKYNTNYTDKMEVVVKYKKEITYVFKDIPCMMNHIDMYRLFKEVI